MKKLIVFLLYVLLAVASMAQQKVFLPATSRLTVYNGDTVAILTDSAYIINAAQALLLNEKLMALKEAHQVNLSLNLQHTTLLTKVKRVEEEVTKLLNRLQDDHRLMKQNLLLILSDLDQSIAVLKHTNTQLALNNEDLQAQLELMDQTLKHLRQENRRMAWRSTRDKVLLSVIALLVGYMVGSL